jgi:acyl carrier protein
MTMEGGKGLPMSDTETRVRKLIVAKLGVDAVNVVEQASFKDDLGADSLDIVDLIMATEDEFQITVDEADDDVLIDGTFGQLIAVVEQKLAGKRETA